MCVCVCVRVCAHACAYVCARFSPEECLIQLDNCMCVCVFVCTGVHVVKLQQRMEGPYIRAQGIAPKQTVHTHKQIYPSHAKKRLEGKQRGAHVRQGWSRPPRWNALTSVCPVTTKPEACRVQTQLCQMEALCLEAKGDERWAPPMELEPCSVCVCYKAYAALSSTKYRVYISMSLKRTSLKLIIERRLFVVQHTILDNCIYKTSV